MMTRVLACAAALSGVVVALFAPAVGASILGGGDVHTVVVNPDGTVWAWGVDLFGQLGDGRVGARYAPVGPVRVHGLRDVVAVAAGGNHNLALCVDGSVWTWGDNLYGELGDGTREMRTVPVRVGGLANVTAIAAGFLHSAALESDGSVWTWGNDIHGQLGDGRHDGDRLTPVRVVNLAPTRAISAGFFHTIAIDRSGGVWTWGQNTHGQLGDGTHANRDRPVRLDLANVDAVSGGQAHTMALRADGAVMSWGANVFGQLGYATDAAGAPAPSNGTAPDRDRPTVVPSLPRVVQVAAGEDFSAVLADDHTVWGWGDNLYGELGDGTWENRARPVRALVPGEVTGIAAGHSHTIAVRADGSVFTWGFGYYGQLGLGRIERRLAQPTEVAAISLRPMMYGSAFTAFTSQDTKSAPLGHWANGHLIIRGTAPSEYGYAASFTTVKAGPGHDVRSFVAEGDLKTGGVTVGVQAHERWVFTQNISMPGPFLVRWEPPAVGDYTVVIAHYSETKDLRMDVELSHIGWFRAPPSEQAK